MSISTFRVIFFRTFGVGKFANSCLVQNHTTQLQGYRCYHGINRVSREGVEKGVYCTMDENKKRKTGKRVWRQISTQPSPIKDHSLHDVPTELANAISIEQGGPGVYKMDEAEASIVSSSSLNDVQKDSEGIVGSSSTASVAQDISGVQNTGKTNISKEKHAVSVELPVGASVMKFIKGKDGSTQKAIEEMGVKIKLPKNNKGDSVVIKGDSMDDIAKASQKIQSIIDEAAKSSALGYSHFISLPLAIHPELVDKVNKFQSSVLGHGDCSRAGGSGHAGKIDQSKNDLAVGVTLKVKDDTNRVAVDICNIPTVSYAPKAAILNELRIDESIFLKPQRLHLTVLMLKLWNKQRVVAAMDVLKGICSEVNEVLDNRPLFVRLNGLIDFTSVKVMAPFQDLMRGSKEKAKVLYAPVQEVGDEDRLKRACQMITDAYVKAGLVFEEDAGQKLKLHATLMNTTFRRRDRKEKRSDNSFNATGIFEQFGSKEWGEYHIREAHLSQRFVYDDNGYYHCCTSIPFPGQHPSSEI